MYYEKSQPLYFNWKINQKKPLPFLKCCELFVYLEEVLPIFRDFPVEMKGVFNLTGELNEALILLIETGIK